MNGISNPQQATELSAEQLPLLPSEIAERFQVWKASRGGAQLLRFAYQETARFAARFERTGQRVSMDYIMHILRDRIGKIKNRLARTGVVLPKEGGYRINDHFTAHIARHIMARRPEWDGLFEKRQLGAKRMAARKTVVITEYRAEKAGSRNWESRNAGNRLPCDGA